MRKFQNGQKIVYNGEEVTVTRLMARAINIQTATGRVMVVHKNDPLIEA